MGEATDWPPFFLTGNLGSFLPRLRSWSRFSCTGGSSSRCPRLSLRCSRWPRPSLSCSRWPRPRFSCRWPSRCPSLPVATFLVVPLSSTNAVLHDKSSFSQFFVLRCLILIFCSLSTVFLRWSAPLFLEVRRQHNTLSSFHAQIRSVNRLDIVRIYLQQPK